ncbi:MAG: hypothetical protein IJR37_03120 [Schwartzia sp.]|nr:hypothetical protein [Schwartzia sp. (in: firmicutes)]
MSPTEIVALIGEVITLLGVVVSCIVAISKIVDGQKCLMRSEMLRIYYHNRDKGEIRQYEYENFVLLYEAYKRLKGNSFIDKVYKEVQTWKVIT